MLPRNGHPTGVVVNKFYRQAYSPLRQLSYESFYFHLAQELEGFSNVSLVSGLVLAHLGRVSSEAPSWVVVSIGPFNSRTKGEGGGSGVSRGSEGSNS